METAIELDKSDSEEYKIEAICNSAVYTKESDNGPYLPGLYYWVLWKSYPEEENTWQPALPVLHLCKLISTFHHDHLEKPTATSPPIDSVSPMAKPTVKSGAEASSKQKWGRPAKDSSASKRAKKTWTASFLSCFLALSR